MTRSSSKWANSDRIRSRTAIAAVILTSSMCENNPNDGERSTVDISSTFLPISFLLPDQSLDNFKTYP
ncbi:MAG: hypothetical protein M3258_04120 [Thermoproteota archaeon]|nr:hypothetical protein [Thermoproteota archaeon]